LSEGREKQKKAVRRLSLSMTFATNHQQIRRRSNTYKSAGRGKKDRNVSVGISSKGGSNVSLLLFELHGRKKRKREENGGINYQVRGAKSLIETIMGGINEEGGGGV